MEIIKHGIVENIKRKRLKFTCPTCGCEFVVYGIDTKMEMVYEPVPALTNQINYAYGPSYINSMVRRPTIRCPECDELCHDYSMYDFEEDEL